MDTKCGTITHSKAPTNPFLGTACKQQRHYKFMNFKKSSSSQVTNVPLLSGEQTVISVAGRAGFPVSCTNQTHTRKVTALSEATQGTGKLNTNWSAPPYRFPRWTDSDNLIPSPNCCAIHLNRQTPAAHPNSLRLHSFRVCMCVYVHIYIHIYIYNTYS